MFNFEEAISLESPNLFFSFLEIVYGVVFDIPSSRNAVVGNLTPASRIPVQ
jgi:hypothetical protein